MYYAYSSAHDLAERVGCRLLTLDAYAESIAFYERLGFVRNQAKAYEGKAHPSMRLDLFAPAVPAWDSGQAQRRRARSRADLAGAAPLFYANRGTLSSAAALAAARSPRRS